jgi:hypothetical protein
MFRRVRGTKVIKLPGVRRVANQNVPQLRFIQHVGTAEIETQNRPFPQCEVTGIGVIGIGIGAGNLVRNHHVVEKKQAIVGGIEIRIRSRLK